MMYTILPQCTTVFDVGANVGDWTALALKINPNLQIHCFEPSAATFQRLHERDFKGSVKYINIGLSSAPGEATLYVFEHCAGTNSLYKRQGLEDGWGLKAQQHKETIRLTTLDAYCQRSGIQMIDFVKVDVEGHELEVIRGAEGMLKQRRIKRIQFEYGGCNIDSRVLLKDIFDFFAPYSYVFFKVLPHGLRHVPRYDQRLENFQYQNWAVIAEDVSF